MMKKHLSLAVIQAIWPVINDDTNEIASASKNKAGAI